MDDEKPPTHLEKKNCNMKLGINFHELKLRQNEPLLVTVS